METITGDRASCEKACAQAIAAEITTIGKSQANVCLGLCGGTSVSGIYSLLAKESL